MSTKVYLSVEQAKQLSELREAKQARCKELDAETKRLVEELQAKLSARDKAAKAELDAMDAEFWKIADVIAPNEAEGQAIYQADEACIEVWTAEEWKAECERVAEEQKKKSSDPFSAFMEKVLGIKPEDLERERDREQAEASSTPEPSNN